VVQWNVGSLGSSINGLHNSVTNLDEDKYLISKEAKKRLLKPIVCNIIVIINVMLLFVEGGGGMREPFTLPCLLKIC
jgi:hypothetical protein